MSATWLPPHDFPTARNPFEESARKRPNRLRFDCIDQGTDRVQRDRIACSGIDNNVIGRDRDDQMTIHALRKFLPIIMKKQTA